MKNGVKLRIIHFIFKFIQIGTYHPNLAQPEILKPSISHVLRAMRFTLFSAVLHGIVVPLIFGVEDIRLLQSINMRREKRRERERERERDGGLSRGKILYYRSHFSHIDVY